jgi:hypothetical protein
MPLKHALAYVFNINIHLLYKVEELTRHEKLLKGREKVRWTVTSLRAGIQLLVDAEISL